MDHYTLQSTDMNIQIYSIQTKDLHDKKTSSPTSQNSIISSFIFVLGAMPSEDYHQYLQCICARTRCSHMEDQLPH